MHTDQSVKKRLRDEFNDIESKNMWNITFRVSKLNNHFFLQLYGCTFHSDLCLYLFFILPQLSLYSFICNFIREMY